MSSRETDTTTALAGIAGIVIILCFCICNGINHTLVKLGVAVIAGIAGFSIRGLIRWN